jgi:hypothetical protein
MLRRRRRRRKIIIIIQLNSYLFTCKLKSPEANYKVRTSKKKETATIKHKQNKIQGNLCRCNNNNNKNKFIMR